METVEKLHFFYKERRDIIGIIDAAGNLVVEYKYDDARNLVYIPADKYARLHTNAYYLYVNSRIIIARCRGGYASVIKELNLLQIEIRAGTILK